MLLRFFKKVQVEKNMNLEYVKAFYKGTLRVLLILLHDWRDFLSDYAFLLCEDIPESFI